MIEESTAIVVLGLRSGTSALAGVINHLGVYFGYDLMPPAEDNRRGFWEHLGIERVHQQLLADLGSSWHDSSPLPLGWEMSAPAVFAWDRIRYILERDFGDVPLWGVKDPRMCRLLPLWMRLLSDLGVAPRFVISVRDPRDVAASLTLRNGFDEGRCLTLWRSYLRCAVEGSRGHPTSFVRYDDLLDPPSWRRVTERLSSELDVTWPHVEGWWIDRFLTGDLRHHRSDPGLASDLPGYFGEDVIGA